MAQNTTINTTAGTWTQLTDADVTAITFQNSGNYDVLIKGTSDATAPTDISGALRYSPGQGELNVDMSDLFPGISSARLWAFSNISVAMVVSHA